MKALDSAYDYDGREEMLAMWSSVIMCIAKCKEMTYMFSVAINGSSSAILLAMTFSYTTRPLVTLFSMIKQASVVKKASGSVMRRLALQISVIKEKIRPYTVNSDDMR